MTRFLVLLLSFSAALLRGQTGASAPTDVSGTVLDADTHQPIGGALVKLLWSIADQRREIAIRTDSTGAFRVSNIPFGYLTASCERAGYLTSPERRRISPGGTSTFYLRKQAVILGTVTNLHGTGLRAEITVLRMQPIHGRWGAQQVALKTTDTEGEFRVAGLNPGRYYVAVQPSSIIGKIAYSPAFYPGATRLSDAQMFDLRPGSEEHLDFRLAPQPAYQVRGTIEIDSESVSCSLIRILDSQRIGYQGGCSWRPTDHRFVFENVTPGTYIVEAHFAEAGRSHTATKNITVSGGNVEGIVLTAASDRKLHGTVVQDVSPRPKTTVELSAAWSTTFTIVEPDGTFTMPEVLSGLFHAYIGFSEPQCLHSVHQAGGDAMRQGVLIAKDNPDPLEVILSTRCGKIEGSVDPSLTRQAPVYTIFLRRLADDLIMDSQTLTSSYGPLNEWGKFVSRSLAPGEYLVFAWTPVLGNFSQLPYSTPEFLRRFGKFGEKVTVRDGEKTRVILHQLLPAEAFDQD